MARPKLLPKLAELKKMGPLELMDVINEAIRRGATVYAQEVIKIRNKLVGYKGVELKQKNRKDAQESYKKAQPGIKKRKKDRQKAKEEKMKMAKLKKIWKKAGLTPDDHKLFEFGIPNYLVLEMGKKAYKEMMKLINDLPGNKNRIPWRTLSKEIDVEWAKAEKIYQEELDDLDKNLKRDAIEKVEDFLKVYFMNIEQNDAIIEMVKKYLEHLPEHKIYNIITMMQSDKFKRFWDSDQHTDEENWAELQNNRVRDLFEVLRNETGIN